MLCCHLHNVIDVSFLCHKSIPLFFKLKKTFCSTKTVTKFGTVDVAMKEEQPVRGFAVGWPNGNAFDPNWVLKPTMEYKREQHSLPFVLEGREKDSQY